MVQGVKYLPHKCENLTDIMPWEHVCNLSASEIGMEARGSLVVHGSTGLSCSGGQH